MHSLRVLVVDDVFTMRELIKGRLIKGGHQVVGEAKDGEEAIRLFRELQPDLITMDVNMPIMDGLTSLRHIRKLNPDVPVVTITSSRDQQVRKDMEEAGSFLFVRKPFQPGYLLNGIEHIQPRKLEDEWIVEKKDSTVSVGLPRDEELFVSSVPTYTKLEDMSERLAATMPTFNSVAAVVKRAEVDDLDDLLHVEMDIRNEQYVRPDPNLVVKSDIDSIVVDYGSEQNNLDAKLRMEAHALVPPEKESLKPTPPPMKPPIAPTIAPEAVVPVVKPEVVEVYIEPTPATPVVSNETLTHPVEEEWQPRPRFRLGSAEDEDTTPALEPTIERVSDVNTRSGRANTLRNKNDKAILYEQATSEAKQSSFVPTPPRNARYRDTQEKLHLQKTEPTYQEHELVIYNGDPSAHSAKEEKPSLWKTVLDFFRNKK